MNNILLSKEEALYFANLLMTNRNFCEIARNRILIEVRKLQEPILEDKIVELVCGHNR